MQYVSRLKHLGLVCLCAVSMQLFGCALIPRQPSSPPQPFDPLTEAERREAGRIAAADAKVMALLGTGRQELVYSEFVAPKSAAGTPSATQGDSVPGRHAEVVLYRYDGDRGVRALVDLAGKAVREAIEIEGDSVPLTRANLMEAITVALRSSEIIQQLRMRERTLQGLVGDDPGEESGSAVRALMVHPTDEKHECWKRRC